MRRKIVCSGRIVCSRKGSAAAVRISLSILRASTVNSLAPTSSPPSPVEPAPPPPSPPRPQDTRHVEELVAVGRARLLGGQTDDEALQVAPQLQQDAFTGEVDRGYLNAVARPDEDEGVVGQPADRLMNRRAAEPRH